MESSFSIIKNLETKETKRTYTPPSQNEHSVYLSRANAEQDRAPNKRHPEISVDPVAFRQDRKRVQDNGKEYFIAICMSQLLIKFTRLPSQNFIIDHR